MRILFAMNPKAGRGNTLKQLPRLENLLQEKEMDYEVRWTEGPGDATIFTKDMRDDFDLVTVFGGDGTMNEVLNGLVGGNTPMAVIPIGTGNDFVRSANLPMKLETSLENILNGKPRKIDLGLYNGERYFVNVVGIGFDAFANIQSRKIKKLKGTAVYVVAIFKTLRQWSSIRMKIALDDHTIDDHSYLTCIANGWSVGGGLSLAPDARLEDGFFDICHVSDISSMKIVWNFPKLMNGKINDMEEVTILRSRKVKVTSEEPLPMHLDGEIIEGENKVFEVEIIPGGFTIWDGGMGPD